MSLTWISATCLPASGSLTVVVVSSCCSLYFKGMLDFLRTGWRSLFEKICGLFRWVFLGVLKELLCDGDKPKGWFWSIRILTGGIFILVVGFLDLSAFKVLLNVPPAIFYPESDDP